MTRWQPDARGRLAQAALALYGERGFDNTTVADIAEQAGLTKRTFFRYFADKREVLFSGAQELEELFVTAVGAAPQSATPLEAVAQALRQRGVGESAAILTAEAGITVFRVAFERWAQDGDRQDFQRLIREALEELRAVTAA